MVETDIHLNKIFNELDANNLGYLLKNPAFQKKLDQSIKLSKGNLRKISQQFTKSHNHLDQNYHLANKKALFYNIRNYQN